MAYTKGREVFSRQHSSTSLLQFRGLEGAPHGTQNVQRERQNGAEKLDDSLEVRGWGWLEAAQGPGQGSPTATQMGNVEELFICSGCNLMGQNSIGAKTSLNLIILY